MALVLLIVHPERFPTNDPVVVNFHAYEDGDPMEGFDNWYATEIAAQSDMHDRRIVILDGMAYDDYERELEEDGEHEFVNGLPVDGWEVVQADPGTFDEIRGVIPPGSQVTVGGFARNDCVAKVANILREEGSQALVSDSMALPLPDSMYERFLRETEDGVGAAAHVKLNENYQQAKSSVTCNSTRTVTGEPCRVVGNCPHH